MTTRHYHLRIPYVAWCLHVDHEQMVTDATKRVLNVTTIREFSKLDNGNGRQPQRSVVKLETCKCIFCVHKSSEIVIIFSA